MKTNKEFYNAVDWVKTHGIDFYNQFDENLFNSAHYYVQEVRNGRNKSEVLKEIRNGKCFYENNGYYGIME